MAERRRTPSHLAPRLIALLAPLAFLAPTAAHAETVVSEDSVGDVQGFDVADPDLAWVPRPDDVSTDIVRTSATFGASRLRVEVHYQDLVNTWFLNTSLRVRTADSRFDFVAVRKPGSRMKWKLFRGRGDVVACRGLRATYDGGADVVMLSLPAACIGTPRWVQLGVGAMGADLTDLDEPEDVEDIESFILSFDDANRDTVREDGLAIGPRIHRD